MMSKTLKVPDCVQFNRSVWNSEPFSENFLHNLKARRYYSLDEPGCRNSLINLFSVLDFWTMQTESQNSVRAILSSLSVLLAVNIRESDSAPLVQSFDEDEFATDPLITQRFEQPISKRNQVSEEIQNAVRSVKKFDVIAPLLAWAIVRFLEGGIAVTKTVDSELLRWSQNGNPVQHPRGCVAFLERKLPFVRGFSFIPSDLATLVKTTAVYLKNNALKPVSTGSMAINEQLVTFTRCFIEKSLGPWVPLEEIAGGSSERQATLIESLQEHCGGTQLVQGIANLSLFCENIAKHFDNFKLGGHYVYSVYKSSMLSYFSQSQNSELTTEIHRVKDILSKVRNVEDLDRAANDEGSAAEDLRARQHAKSFLISLAPDERLRYLESMENSASDVERIDQGAQSAGKPGRKKKRRRRRN